MSKAVVEAARESLVIGYSGDTWTWKLFDDAGRITAESRWQGKNLLDANVACPSK